MGRKNALKKHLNGVFRSILLIYGEIRKDISQTFYRII